MIGRRGFITGLVSLVAAPAIVRVGSIMPVRMMPVEPIYGVSPAILGLTEAGLIEDVFLAQLFKTLSTYPDMTATQIVEMCNVGTFAR